MQFEEKTHYILATNCFVVDGAERSLIYDLHRNNYDIITRELSEALKKCHSGSFAGLFEYLPQEDIDFYEPFIASLVEKDYLLPVDPEEIEYFKPMSLEWEYPYTLSAVVMEYATDSPYTLKEAFTRINTLNCPAVEIRFTNTHDIDFYRELCETFDGMGFRHIDLLVQYASGQENDFMFALKNLHPVLFSITQYGSPEETIVRNTASQYLGLKRTTRTYQEIVSNQQVYSKNFYINRNFFTEARFHHPFFNGKITICANGDIKNGTHQPRSFGNIADTDLGTLIKDPAFTELWHVSKDKISICQDCEYRYMCMDSRIPLRQQEGKWIMEDPCNYDPYTCKWHSAVSPASI
jgi:SPASM domain peptide maturase of grasp-with-spasm system